MEQKIILGVVGVLIVAAIGIFVFAPTTEIATDVPAGKYTELATCIKDSGATFFGAWWCPHCKAQKEMFGDAVDKLPYIECSTPDGNSQLPACQNLGINNYPTWVFADHSTSTGEIPLATLAEKTSCALPI
ncbi:MAG: thioredoxin domain-containing protein [Patescibacteria group bacterium]